ncbi:MAG: TetR/AcrR family transcriptional regulator [Clostridiales bacterium]|nr:TetR/AcrR family transcriptional regulator [Clostridiales bacterium]
MKKQPEITDATRENLVNSFFQLARKNDITQITVREIINLAGYSRATFYRYFKDVFALVEYAEDSFFEKTRAALAEHEAGNGAYDRRFFEIFIKCFNEDPVRISVLTSEQNLSHFIRRMREKTIDNINTQIADTPKKEAVTNMFFFSVFSAIASHIQNPKALPDEDLLDIIQKLFADWYWPQMTGTTNTQNAIETGW